MIVPLWCESRYRKGFFYFKIKLMNWRLKRQLTYLGIFFSFLLIIFFIFYLSKPAPLPSCFDNKKNQGEEDIDCGGPCPPCELRSAQPLRIYPSEILVYSDSIDIVGIVENSNSKLALEKLKYYFEIYDLDNNLKATTTIKETILEPDQKRYLLELNYPKPNFSIGKIKLKLLEPKDEDWRKLELERPKISFYNQKIYQENNKLKLSLTLFNQTFLPYKDIEIIILLYNTNNNLVGLTKSLVSLNAEEVKDLVLTFPWFVFEPTGFEIIFQRTNLEI